MIDYIIIGIIVFSIIVSLLRGFVRKSLESLDARSAGMIIALEPVYAIACAWWLFGEEPSGRMLVGASLIILATVLLAMGHTPSAARKGASDGVKA